MGGIVGRGRRMSRGGMYAEGHKVKAPVTPEIGNDIIYRTMAKTFDYVSSLRSPRFIKSHLPLTLLPPALLDTCRVVYVARDPRDVAVSYYHHYRNFLSMGYTGDFKQYWNYFIKDLLDYTPYFENVKEMWEKRYHPNLLFLFYEDIKKDLPSTIKRVSKFLEKPVTEEQVSRACEYLSIDSFKKNKAVNMEFTKELKFTNPKSSFIRKGKTGGWRDVFDEEMVAQAERWIADNLRDTDLRFPSMS